MCASTQVQAATNYRFDDDEDFIAEAESWPAWHNVVQKGLQEERELLECVADESVCPAFLKGARVVVERGRTLDRRNQLKLVNRFVNRHKRTRRDRQRAVSEISGETVVVQWSTLFEFLRVGGDCDDFATAKYQLLRAMGFKEDELRVVVVWFRDRREYHALVAVNHPPTSSSLLDIDNRIYRHRPHQYRFIYAVNANGIWNHGVKVRKRRKRS